MRTTLTLLTALLALGCADTDNKASDDDGTTDATTADDSDDGGEGDDGGDDGSGDDGSGDDGSGDDGSGDDGGDDGSGDGGDDIELSEVNSYSTAGCELMETDAETLVMGASRSEANTAVIVPDDNTAWMLQMPATGDGWFTVEVPDWMTVVHFFTEEGVELEIMGGEPFSEVLRNGACPDAGISDQRWAFHEWGAYTIRVAEGAPSEVWFTLVKED